MCGVVCLDVSEKERERERSEREIGEGARHEHYLKGSLG